VTDGVLAFGVGEGSTNLHVVNFGSSGKFWSGVRISLGFAV